MLDRTAPTLSGGEQQKLTLARATREIEDILLAAKKAGTKLILSTHDFGPFKTDPVEASKAQTAAEAHAAIPVAKARFVSRGDESATHNSAPPLTWPV